MNCVIACHKPWCISLAEKLEKKSKYHFIAINKKEELTLTLLDEVKPDYIFFLIGHLLSQKRYITNMSV